MNFIDYGIHVSSSATGNVKTTCPQCSPTRRNSKDPCLSVNVSEGVWNCHHCDFSGGLGKGKYKRPDYEYTKPTKYDWFAKRGIGQSTVEELKIKASETHVMFPYFRGEIVCNVKSKPIVDGKNYSQSKEAEPIFYNLNGLKDSTYGVIVEGEMDVLSLYDCGVKQTVSVPSGAPGKNDKSADGKLKCLETCEKDIEHIKQWLIFVDNDDNGKRLEVELIRRLGAENCKVVDWSLMPGCKDANDILVKHGRNELKMFIAASKPCPVEGEHHFSEYEDQLDLERQGVPIHKVLDNGWSGFSQYKVAQGYVTTVTGVPSSGKSTFTANLAVNMARRHGWKFGMFCPENPGRSMLKKVVQAYCKNALSQIEESLYRDAKLFAFNFFYEVIGSDDKVPRTVDNVLKLASVYVRRYGIKGLVIDAYSRLEKEFSGTQNETQYIGVMLDKVSRWAKKHDCHVWVVAHPLKMEKDNNGLYKVVKPYDISGSSHWYNSSDMILSIYRHVSAEANQKVSVYVQKVKEEPDFGELGYHDFMFDQEAGVYNEIQYS